MQLDRCRPSGNAHLKDSDQCRGKLVEILQRCFVLEAESMFDGRSTRRARTPLVSANDLLAPE